MEGQQSHSPFVMVQSVPEAGEGASVLGEASAVACQREREREREREIGRERERNFLTYFPLSVSNIPSTARISLTYTSTVSHQHLCQQVGTIV